MSLQSVTGFSVEVRSKVLAEMMEVLREHGQPTRVTLTGVGAILYIGEAKGQIRMARLVEKRLQEIDPTATVRRVTSI